MEAIGYFTTPKVKRAAYQPTELDYAKEAADILLDGIYGNYYSIWLNKDIELKGRGVKEQRGRRAVVTEKYYYKLLEQYDVLTDF